MEKKLKYVQYVVNDLPVSYIMRCLYSYTLSEEPQDQIKQTTAKEY